MSNNFKYTMQKHKGKFWVGGSILATVVIGAGVWFTISEDSPFSFQKESISHLAEHVITGTQDGDLKMISVENKETVATWDLPKGEEYLFYKDRIHEMFYAYNGNSLVVLSEEDGAFNYNEFRMDLVKVESPSEFAFDGKLLSVYSDETGKVSILDVENNRIVYEVTEKEPVIQLLPVLNDVYYITESELVKATDAEEKRMELGSELVSIHEDAGRLLIHSAFGQDKGDNVLFDVNAETLEIESLQKTGSPNTVLLSKDDGEDYYLAGDYVKTEDAYHYLFNRYQAGVEGLNKDNLTVTVPTGESALLMDSDNALVDRDYIYVHDEESFKIFDVKSQEQIHDIPVDVDFAMPILYEKGDTDE